MRFPPILWPLLLASSPLLAQGSTKVSVRFDCLHNDTQNKGSTQGCITLSDLKIHHTNKIDDDTKLMVELNPFGSPVPSMSHLVEQNDAPLPSIDDSSALIFSNYALVWQFRPRLSLAIRHFANRIPAADIHQLATGSRFSYTGWGQTALTATYTLGKDADSIVQLAIGNGEGEPTRNLDPQQYGSLFMKTKLIEGFHIEMWGSFDGNTYGSETNTYIYGADPSETKAGFSNQRIAVSLILDGRWSYIPGLKGSLSWLQTTAKDLDKNITSIDPESYANNRRYINGDLLIEDPTGQASNQVETTVYDVSLSYAIMATHFLALNYEMRTIDSGDVAFFVDEGGSSHKNLTQLGYTFGAGIQLSQELLAIVEYRAENYNKTYTRFNFAGDGDKRARNLNLYNVRIAYQW